MMWVCPQECNIHRGQKRKLDPLELKLHAFVRHLMWNHLEECSELCNPKPSL